MKRIFSALIVSLLACSGMAAHSIGQADVSNVLEPTPQGSKVSYHSSVVPMGSQEKYDILLDINYQTHVPDSAVTVDPPSARYNLAPGESADGRYTLTNNGEKSVFNVNVSPEADAKLTLDIPFAQVPEIKPGRTVVVPYRITLKRGGAASAFTF